MCGRFWYCKICYFHSPIEKTLDKVLVHLYEEHKIPFVRDFLLERECCQNKLGINFFLERHGGIFKHCGGNIKNKIAEIKKRDEFNLKLFGQI